MSLLPDELAELMARTRALQEAHKAQGLDILNDPRTTVRRARMPFMVSAMVSTWRKGVRICLLILAELRSSLASSRIYIQIWVEVYGD